MEYKQIYNNLSEIHTDIRKSNDFIVQAARRLQSVLFNLEIISEHLVDGKMIDPITHELQLIRDEMNKNVTDLIDNRRMALIEVMGEFKKNVEEE